jgi:NAD(P)-dependent dehydrogenase (short-subunit alcohol dehydrogenase family)
MAQPQVREDSAMTFQGKRIFVTGAASGIGAATVELLAGQGAEVVGVDITDAGGVLHCDVTDAASVTAAMATAVESLGGLDVLCNVAGINQFSHFGDMSREMWDRHLAVNLTGPMLVTQAALPHLRESRGNIVTVASISGIQGQPWNSAYCASKGGLLLLMKSLAVELAADGIRVNCVCPGGVDTPLSANAGATMPTDVDFKMFDRMTGVLPGFMPPGDVAGAIAYLASDAAASVTGASLVIDRGTLW